MKSFCIHNSRCQPRLPWTPLSKARFPSKHLLCCYEISKGCNPNKPEELEDFMLSVVVRPNRVSVPWVIGSIITYTVRRFYYFVKTKPILGLFALKSNYENHPTLLSSLVNDGDTNEGESCHKLVLIKGVVRLQVEEHCLVVIIGEWSDEIRVFEMRQNITCWLLQFFHACTTSVKICDVKRLHLTNIMKTNNLQVKNKMAEFSIQRHYTLEVLIHFSWQMLQYW